MSLNVKEIGFEEYKEIKRDVPHNEIYGCEKGSLTDKWSSGYCSKEFDNTFKLSSCVSEYLINILRNGDRYKRIIRDCNTNITDHRKGLFAENGYCNFMGLIISNYINSSTEKFITFPSNYVINPYYYSYHKDAIDYIYTPNLDYNLEAIDEYFYDKYGDNLIYELI